MTAIPAISPIAVCAPDDGGWSAELNCRFEPGPQRTIVRRTHKGPLCMQRPFYPEGAIAHVYMLHPPGGVVAGDLLHINASSVDGGQGLVSTPGATKFYRSDGDVARVQQRLDVNDGSLEWLPAENIFFSGSRAHLSTRLHLKGDASIAWWEINCFGQHIGDEPYENGLISNVVEVHQENTLLLRERLQVGEAYPLSMSCGMRNNRVAGTLLLIPVQEHSVEYARQKLADLPGFSSTWIDSMLIVRYLGHSAEDAKAGFAKVWSGLRVGLNRAAPALPRIWAT